MKTFGYPTSIGRWGFQDQGGCTPLPCIAKKSPTLALEPKWRTRHSAQGLRYCRVKALPNQPYMTHTNTYIYIYIYIYIHTYIHIISLISTRRALRPVVGPRGGLRLRIAARRGT